MSSLSRVTGGGPPKDSQEVKIDYQLFAVGATQAPKVSGNAKASNGGFGVGSALRLASLCGPDVHERDDGRRGDGDDESDDGMSSMGGLGPMAGGLFDPRASAMTSMMSSLGRRRDGGNGRRGGNTGHARREDPSESALRDTVSEALGNSAKAVMEQLGKKK